MKRRFDDGDSGSKKCKRGCCGAYGGGGSLESGGRFCVGAFGSNLASVAVKMFSHLIYFFFFRNFINFVLSMRFAKIMLQ
jgi:hypothetical protein